MNNETKKKLLSSKKDVLKAQHDNDLFYNIRIAVEEIFSLLQILPEARESKKLSSLFEEVFENLHEGEFETLRHLDACETEYISILEEMADEEELFFVSDFGDLDFLQEEEPEEE